MTDAESPRPRRHRSRRGESSRTNRDRKRRSQARRPETGSEDARGERERRSQSLSTGALDQLNKDNARKQRHNEREQRRRERYTERDRDRERDRERERDRDRERQRQRDRDRHRERDRDQEDEGTPLKKPRKHTKPKKPRVVSGAVMEEGRAKGFGFLGLGLRGGGHSRDNSGDSLEKEDFYYKKQPPKKKSRKKLWIILGISAVILLIIIVVAVVVSQKNKNDDSGGSSGSSSPSGISPGDVPTQWKGTYLDPFTWATTSGFNTTFTDQMVGDLPVMGLNSNWDDSAQANSNVPPLNKPWGSYSSKPARGVNLGGWLSLEPFITPSLFNYAPSMGVIDEWTLCQHLGSSANKTLENHYASFVTEQTFKDIQAAGLDHVRIPFSYWAVQVYPGDPYIFRTSWRYLLRGIEWARKYGLRINLDVHGLPGSQNGWNHSGRFGTIGWLNGTDGQLNAQRALDIHDRLSKFFAQPRYKNIITHYGLVNEPKMTYLKVSDVVTWTVNAYKLVRKNGIDALVIFGDGFMGLPNWQGVMQGYDGLVLDVHQYVIFNENQIDFTHQEKVQYACTGWTDQAVQSQDKSTGYGPTLFAEWSQADTDCAQHLTNVGWGNRWEGTINKGTPKCPTKNSQCSCANANADPSRWSAQYKSFLKMFAEAQMHSFEKGWGWWYWTWKTESAAQWSYEAGMKAGVLPSKAYERDFDCSSDVPDFAKNGLPEYY